MNDKDMNAVLDLIGNVQIFTLIRLDSLDGVKYDIDKLRSDYISMIHNILKDYPLEMILEDRKNKQILLQLGFKPIKINVTRDYQFKIDHLNKIIHSAKKIENYNILQHAIDEKDNLENSVTAYLVPSYFKHYFSKEDSIQYYDCVIDQWVDKNYELDFDDTLNDFFGDLTTDYTGYSIYAVQFKDEQ